MDNISAPYQLDPVQVKASRLLGPGSFKNLPPELVRAGLKDNVGPPPVPGKTSAITDALAEAGSRYADANMPSEEVQKLDSKDRYKLFVQFGLKMMQEGREGRGPVTSAITAGADVAPAADALRGQKLSMINDARKQRQALEAVGRKQATDDYKLANDQYAASQKTDNDSFARVKGLAELDGRKGDYNSAAARRDAQTAADTVQNQIRQQTASTTERNGVAYRGNQAASAQASLGRAGVSAAELAYMNANGGMKPPTTAAATNAATKANAVPAGTKYTGASTIDGNKFNAEVTRRLIALNKDPKMAQSGAKPHQVEAIATAQALKPFIAGMNIYAIEGSNGVPRFVIAKTDKDVEEDKFVYELDAETYKAFVGMNPGMAVNRAN